MAPPASIPPEEECLYRHRICAVVPAAGHGERMKNDTPKQYLQVCGSPLVVHCLRALSEPAWMEKVILVVDEEDAARKALSGEKLPKVSFVKGTGSRHRSIEVGLKALQNQPPDIVVVHDGVRPIVPINILKQVAIKALEMGASGVVRPLVSTVIRPDSSSRLDGCLQRSLYRNSEMPQAFRYNVILAAYEKCSDEDLDYGTECLDLALKYEGVRAYLVEGSTDLWKVTHPHDIETARLLLPKHTIKVGILCPPCSPGLLKERGGTLSQRNLLENDERNLVENDDLASSTKAKDDDSISLESFLRTYESIKISSGSHNENLDPVSLRTCSKILTVSESDRALSLCVHSASTIAHLSSSVRKRSVSAHVTTSAELIPKDCGCVLIVQCVSTVTDATVVLSEAKNSLSSTRVSTLVVVLNKKVDTVTDKEFIFLRKSINELFPENEVSVMVIVCSSPDPEEEMLEEGHCTKESLTKKQIQLNLIIEQCFYSPLTKAFHGQILFV